ncbi:MAG: type II toxin-antitoxin system VapC family toxin [bacterium]
MKYLLDTCVISELVKIKPNRNVLDWINSCEEDFFHLSVLTIGEIQKGISKLPESKKKDKLQSWLDSELKERFAGKILNINAEIAKIWGNIQGIAEKKGKMIPAIDALIAATGIYYRLTIVTRNVTDLDNSGASLFNPWE